MWTSSHALPRDTLRDFRDFLGFRWQMQAEPTTDVLLTSVFGDVVLDCFFSPVGQFARMRLQMEREPAEIICWMPSESPS